MQNQSLIITHQQTNAQPVPEQSLLWGNKPQFLLLSTVPYGKEYLFGQLGSAVPNVSLPSLLPTASLLTGDAE